MEVIDGLDADMDGAVSAAELEGHAPDVRSYLEQHYRLIVGGDSELVGGTALPMDSFEASWAPPGERAALGNLLGGVTFTMRFRASLPIDDLILEVTLFHDTSPDHIDLATVHWADGRVASFGIMRETPRVRSNSSGGGTFWTFLRLGFDHIRRVWDHLAFVALLFLGARAWSSLIGIITAFTLAHSFTLGAASLSWLNVTVYSEAKEMLIALSIAYVGCMNLLGTVKDCIRWVETFFFGLLHGFGFAAFLELALVAETSRGWALFSSTSGSKSGSCSCWSLSGSSLGRCVPTSRGTTPLRVKPPRSFRLACACSGPSRSASWACGGSSSGRSETATRRWCAVPIGPAGPPPLTNSTGDGHRARPAPQQVWQGDYAEIWHRTPPSLLAGDRTFVR